jgi:hypothetical protein
MSYKSIQIVDVLTSHVYLYSTLFKPTYLTTYISVHYIGHTTHRGLFLSYISGPNVTKLLGVPNAETPVSQQAAKYDLQ